MIFIIKSNKILVSGYSIPYLTIRKLKPLPGVLENSYS